MYCWISLLSFGDVVSSGQESMSLSSSLLFWWLSLLSRWSLPLVELTLSDWCMMVNCCSHWGQFVTESVSECSYFSRCKLQIGFLYSGAPLRRHWPGLTNERPRGISTSYLWSPALSMAGCWEWERRYQFVGRLTSSELLSSHQMLIWQIMGWEWKEYL